MRKSVGSIMTATNCCFVFMVVFSEESQLRYLFVCTCSWVSLGSWSGTIGIMEESKSD